MIKLLSILYIGLWYFIGIGVFVWIYREPSLYVINCILGSIFVCIWGFHTIKFTKSPKLPEEKWILSYKNLEIISLISQILILFILLTGIIHRVFSEKLPVFG